MTVLARRNGESLERLLHRLEGAMSRIIQVFLVLTSAFPGPASAHEFMMTYIAHEVSVVVDHAHIDISVDLKFNELVSLDERRKMDRNQDGRIDSDESAGYLAGLVSTFARGLRLTIGGQSVDVFTLYGPQLDLLGADKVAPAHHVLRLSFFARTPSTFAAGQDISLRDDLWADAPALCSFQATGAGGLQVSLGSSNKILSQLSAHFGDRTALIKTNKIL